MTLQSITRRSFSGGELSPSLGMRADLPKYVNGLKTCRNFLVRRQGGVSNRPGTKYVATCKDPTTKSRLLPFIFEANDQTYVLEFGDHYIRFYWHGEQVVVTSVPAYAGGTTYAIADLVVDGGINYYSLQDGNVGNTPASSPTFWYPLEDDIYEVPTDYDAADLAKLAYTQSADVLTLTHALYPPMELQRLDHTQWRMVTFVTGPSIDPPAGAAGVAGAAGALTMKYVITAAKADTYEESYVSNVATIAACATPTTAAPNTLSWTAVTGAVEYYVYCDPYNNGIYGFMGTASTNAFNDVGFTPDFTVTSPIPVTLFASTGDYPSVACYYQQRLVFGRSVNQPETVWASKVGAYHNFSISTPLQDDDAVTFVIASNELQTVVQLESLRRLIVMSDRGEWSVNGDSDGVLTPSTIRAEQSGSVGAFSVRPVVIGDTVFYVQARGNVLRQLRFDQQLYSPAFIGADLTVDADHLFNGNNVVDLGFHQQPHSIVWAILNSGTLLGLTYIPAQQLAGLSTEPVFGWHRHDTGANGQFESVCVVPDASVGEDVSYFIVKRTINGSDTRYVERLASRLVTLLERDAFFVDSGQTYTGSPATTFTGLDHLEGEIVAVLADGLVIFDGDPDSGNAASFTVAGGSISIPVAASIVHIGLPIRFAQIETLSLDVEGTALRDKKKRVQSLTMIVNESGPRLWAGPDDDHLIKWRPEPWKTMGKTTNDPLAQNLTTSFTDEGRIIIRNTDPLPVEILGIVPNLEVGG